jgi:quercetin dioxygenase-like cupin family protein
MAKLLTVVDDLATETTSQLFLGRDHGVDVSFFLNHTAPGRTVSQHRHPYPEVFVVQDGEVTFTVDGEDVVAHGGQVVVVPAGTSHGFTNSGDRTLEMTSIHPAAEMETEWL